MVLTTKSPKPGAAMFRVTAEAPGTAASPRVSFPEGLQWNPVQERVRRPHHKSRSGCTCCKKKRIKCDEKRPSCSGCLKSNDDCQYITASTKHSSSSNKSASPPLPTDSPTTPLPTSNNDTITTNITGPNKRRRGEVDDSEPASAAQLEDIDNLQSLNHSPSYHASTPPTTPPTLAPPNPIPSPVFSLEEMHLLHHYYTSTSRTLIYGDHVWQIVIPGLSYKHPFVLHAMLALTAAHLRCSDPSSPPPTNLELHHKGLALSGLRTALNFCGEMDVDMSDAIIACSMVFILHSWCSVDDPDRGSGSSEYFDFSADGLFPLSAGIKNVVKAIWLKKEESAFQDIFRIDFSVDMLNFNDGVVLQKLKSCGGKEVFDRIREVPLTPESNNSTSSTPGEAPVTSRPEYDCHGNEEPGGLYDMAIDRLSPLVGIAAAEETGLEALMPFYLFAWPSMCSDDFVTAVRRHDSKALVLLGWYYAAVLKWNLKNERDLSTGTSAATTTGVGMRLSPGVSMGSNLGGFWWVSRRSRLLCRAIIKMLEPEWESYLGWPRKVCDEVERGF